MGERRDRIAERVLQTNARLPLVVLHALGNLVGTLATLIPNKRLATTRTNLAQCFPGLGKVQRELLAWRSMRHAAKSIMEAGRMWLRPPAENLALIRQVDGEEHISAALAAGHGVILATPHLGAWELAGSYVSSRYPLTIMYSPPQLRGLDETIRQGREASGSRYVPADAGGIRAQLQALRAGEMIAYLPDQVPDQGGVVAPFFGTPALTMTLIGKLAGKSGALVIVGFAERLGWSRGYRMHFLPPDPAITTAGEAESAARINAQVEACIRLAPAQYLWMYKRFRGSGAVHYRR